MRINPQPAPRSGHGSNSRVCTGVFGSVGRLTEPDVLLVFFFSFLFECDVPFTSFHLICWCSRRSMTTTLRMIRREKRGNMEGFRFFFLGQEHWAQPGQGNWVLEAGKVGTQWLPLGLASWKG